MTHFTKYRMRVACSFDPKPCSLDDWATFSPWSSTGEKAKDEGMVLSQRLCGKWYKKHI